MTKVLPRSAVDEPEIAVSASAICKLATSDYKVNSTATVVRSPIVGEFQIGSVEMNGYVLSVI